MRRIHIAALVSAFVFCICAVGVHGQTSGVAFDAAAYSSTNDTSLSIPFTTSGSDRILLVGIEDVNTASINSMSQITYGGVPLTEATSSAFVDPNAYVSLWYLVNPPLGTHNLEVARATQGKIMKIAVASYSGVSQVTPRYTTRFQLGGTSFAATPLTAPSGAWIVSFVHNDGPVDTLSTPPGTIDRNVNQNVGFFDTAGNGIPVVEDAPPDFWWGYTLVLAPI